MINERPDLTPSMAIVDVAVGLGFRDETQTGFVAVGNDVRAVSADEGRYRVTGGLK